MKAGTKALFVAYTMEGEKTETVTIVRAKRANLPAGYVAIRFADGSRCLSPVERLRLA